MNIHDAARKIVQQSKAPMSLERAYQLLGRRRRKQLKTPVDLTKIRLPYADN